MIDKRAANFNSLGGIEPKYETRKNAFANSFIPLTSRNCNSLPATSVQRASYSRPAGTDIFHSDPFIFYSFHDAGSILDYKGFNIPACINIISKKKKKK